MLKKNQLYLCPGTVKQANLLNAAEVVCLEVALSEWKCTVTAL